MIMIYLNLGYHVVTERNVQSHNIGKIVGEITRVGNI